MSDVAAHVLPVEAGDGHRFELIARVPTTPRATLLWLPALGVAARHYLPLADALAGQGVSVFLHEWRGNGSSRLRAARDCDWGYRELLALDIPASEQAVASMPACAVPAVIGGHSLGGQLAACRIALSPTTAGALWLVASGAPWWRAFPAPLRWGLRAVYPVLPWLADRCGALPGPRIGFGGREARGVMRDWSRSALGGRYTAEGLGMDLDTALRDVDVDVTAVSLARDWMAPPSSRDFLLSKMPATRVSTALLDDVAAGVRSDHFAWMRHPDAIVRQLARSLDGDAEAQPGAAPR